MDRNKTLIMQLKKTDLRPIIPSIKKNENDSKEEKFQNECLRPIIKLQHDLILACFEHYLIQHKIKVVEMNTKQKEAFFKKTFQNNPRLKTEMRSLIIGLFTFNEYAYYLKNSTEINKRVNAMILQRIKSVYKVNEKP